MDRVYFVPISYRLTIVLEILVQKLPLGDQIICISCDGFKTPDCNKPEWLKNSEVEVCKGVQYCANHYFVDRLHTVWRTCGNTKLTTHPEYKNSTRVDSVHCHVAMCYSYRAGEGEDGTYLVTIAYASKAPTVQPLALAWLLCFVIIDH